MKIATALARAGAPRRHPGGARRLAARQAGGDSSLSQYAEDNVQKTIFTTHCSVLVTTVYFG